MRNLKFRFSKKVLQGFFRVVLKGITWSFLLGHRFPFWTFLELKQLFKGSLDQYTYVSF